MKRAITVGLGLLIALPLWAALETSTYISGLVSSNPTGSDHYSTADDHIRLLKSTLLNTFPGLTGAVTATQDEINKLDGMTTSQAELNYVDGVTSALQTQLDAKQNIVRSQRIITADYTLVLADAGRMVINSNVAAAGVDVTLPPFADVAMTAGSYVEIYNLDGDSITIAPGSGVTLDTNYGSTGSQTLPSGEGGLLFKNSSNGWTFIRWLGDHTHTLSDISDVTASVAEVNVLDGVTATTTELNYIDGVTSAVQTQLNARATVVGSYDTLRCGTATIDFSSIAAGGRSATNITVSGVSAGEPVFIGTTGITTGLVPTGYASLSNTISAGFTNVTTSAVDPASVTLVACSLSAS